MTRARTIYSIIIIIIIIIVFIRVNYINHILQRTYTHNIYLQTHTHIYIDPKRVRYKRDSKNHARYPPN